VRRQVGQLLSLIRCIPILCCGRPFESLAPPGQDRVLRWLQECPISLLQKGFWGLRTLIFMGWYGQHELWPRIGYEPDIDGNRRLEG
jgi:hypothetical protein